MKKIINPWKGLEGYNCFGCAPNNEAASVSETHWLSAVFKQF